MNPKTQQIHCGDNLEVMHKMPDESVDLIYLDPPFFSGKNYEIIWKDGSEIRSFTDKEFYTLKCKCGKIFPTNNKFCAACGAPIKDATEKQSNDIEAYLQWMRPRLEQCHRILNQTGSMYVHLDHHAVHYIKMMMDEIFGNGDIMKGIECFRDNIVWCYSNSGRSKTVFPQKHDDILFYTKGNKYIFNPQKIDVAEHIKKQYPLFDEEKQQYYRIASRGKAGKYKEYCEKYVEDWWIDINSIGGRSKERLKYPTQKPEALLERIIKVSSNPGDIVFDPFCGCGTSISVASKLKRQFIGIDISPTSCKLMVKRLRTNGINITENDIIGLPRTAEELRIMDPFEFQNWVVKQLNGKVNPKKVGDGGIDGWTYKTDEYGLRINQEHDKSIQVKRSNIIGFPEIQKFIGAMQTDKTTDHKKGIFVAFNFSKTIIKNLKDLKAETGISIEIFTVEDLLAIP